MPFTNAVHIGLGGLFVALEGAFAHRQEVALGGIEVAQFVGDFGGHEEDVGVAHDHRLGAVLGLVAVVRMLDHPVIAVLAEVPLGDAGGLEGVVRVDLPVDAGDVPADILFVVLEPEGRDRAGVTAAARAIGVGGSVGTDGERIVPTSAAVAEGNHPENLGSAGQMLGVVELAPEGLVGCLKRSGLAGREPVDIGESLGIKHRGGQFRIEQVA